MQVFNARTQQLEDAQWEADNNGELVAVFADGGFVKFPGDVTEAKLQALVNKHQKANEGQEVITPEMEAAEAKRRKNIEELAERLSGNTMPESANTNASEIPTQPDEA